MTEYRGKKHLFDAGVRIGHGGMADVYVGVSRNDASVSVALKVPLPDLDADLTDMFLREVDAAQRVSSPYIVPIVDWGDAPPFIAFEFMSEGTLGKAIAERQVSGERWSERELIGMFRQLVSGMAAINKQVIHRDLKPDNIFTDQGILRIGDFGIARFVGAVTRSPTFNEMATLQRPFTGDWTALEKAHLYDLAQLVTDIVPELSDRLGQMVRRMLEKQGGDRFALWQEVLDELDAIENRLPAEEPAAEDHLARLAAQQVEQVRARRLEERQKSDAHTLAVERREELVRYWASEFFDAIEKRIDAINASLGTEDVTSTRNIVESNRSAVSGSLATAKPLRAEANAHFLNASLSVFLSTVDIDASNDVVAWGWIKLNTNRRRWLGNVLLLPDPQPYGEWKEVDMRMSGLISVNRPLEDGGEYDVAGQERIVWRATPKASCRSVAAGTPSPALTTAKRRSSSSACLMTS